MRDKREGKKVTNSGGKYIQKGGVSFLYLEIQQVVHLLEDVGLRSSVQ